MAPQQEPARSRVFWDVLEEHRDEAEFSLELFDGALESPTRNLNQLATYPEQRLLAHLDALELGGAAVAEGLLAASLADVGPDRPHAPAVAAFCFVRLSRHRELLDALGHPDQVLRDGTCRGAQLAADHAFRGWLREQLSRPVDLELQASLFGLCARLHEQPPSCIGALQSEDARLVLQACEAARHGDKHVYLPLLEDLLSHDSAAVRDSALVTSLAWGSPAAWYQCERSALGLESAVALALYAGLAGRAQHARLAEALASGQARSALIFALGHTGNQSVLPVLYECLASQSVLEAKLALQSISMITGLDLEDDAIRVAHPPVVEHELLPEPDEDEEARSALPPLDDDDLNADLVPAPELELPQPSPSAIIEYCEKWRHSAPPGRLLGGVAFARENVARYLGRAPMRQRRMLMLLCSIRGHGQAWVDDRALTRVQAAQTASLCATLPDKLTHIGPW